MRSLELASPHAAAMSSMQRRVTPSRFDIGGDPNPPRRRARLRVRPAGGGGGRTERKPTRHQKARVMPRCRGNDRARSAGGKRTSCSGLMLAICCCAKAIISGVIIDGSMAAVAGTKRERRRNAVRRSQLNDWGRPHRAAQPLSPHVRCTAGRRPARGSHTLR